MQRLSPGDLIIRRLGVGSDRIISFIVLYRFTNLDSYPHRVFDRYKCLSSTGELEPHHVPTDALFNTAWGIIGIVHI